MKPKWLIKLFFVLTIILSASGENQFSVHLKVLDPSDKPVTEFEVQVIAANVNLNWKAGKNGEINVSHVGESRYQIIIRAAGFAPTMITMDRPKEDIERTVRLSKGQNIELVLTTKDGRSIPEDLEPIVVFPDFQERVWLSFQHQGRHEFDLNFTSLFKLKPGVYNFHMTEDSPKIYVFIDHPGFMRAFRAGPFGKEEWADGKLEIELPKPVELEIVVEQPNELSGKLPYDVWSVDIVRQSPDNETTGDLLARIKSDEMNMHTDREFLAPGGYWIVFQTGLKDRSTEFKEGQVNPAYYRDVKRVSFAPGRAEKVVFRYASYDENLQKGDYNCTINIRSQDNKPAAGLPYTLSFENMHFGSIAIKKGIIPDNGQIKLTSLAGGEETGYTLEIQEGKLGRYLFQFLGDDKNIELNYNIVPLEGNIALDITVEEIFTGEKVKISDLKGKVIYIEFWATWCGPCQGPMEHLCELAKKRKTDWEGKAVLLCISIDDKKEDVIQYVKSRGWLGVTHCWCHQGEPGFKSNGVKAYGITGVPTALLMNQSGTIIWRGHPGSFDIEANIDKLLTDR
jgi:hypothetical protein